MKQETPDQFVRWLLDQLDDLTKRQDLTWTEVYGRAQKVELGASLKADALTEHEKYTNLIEAGFTETQAFRYLLNERTAIMSAAVTEGIRLQQKGEGGS